MEIHIDDSSAFGPTWADMMMPDADPWFHESHRGVPQSPTPPMTSPLKLPVGWRDHEAEVPRGGWTPVLPAPNSAVPVYGDFDDMQGHTVRRQIGCYKRDDMTGDMCYHEFTPDEHRTPFVTEPWWTSLVDEANAATQASLQAIAAGPATTTSKPSQTSRPSPTSNHSPAITISTKPLPMSP
jgi:hypothetical protein